MALTNDMASAKDVVDFIRSQPTDAGGSPIPACACIMAAKKNIASKKATFQTILNVTQAASGDVSVSLDLSEMIKPLFLSEHESARPYANRAAAVSASCRQLASRSLEEEVCDACCRRCPFREEEKKDVGWQLDQSFLLIRMADPALYVLVNPAETFHAAFIPGLYEFYLDPAPERLQEIDTTVTYPYKDMIQTLKEGVIDLPALLERYQAFPHAEAFLQELIPKSRKVSPEDIALVKMQLAALATDPDKQMVTDSVHGSGIPVPVFLPSKNSDCVALTQENLKSFLAEVDDEPRLSVDVCVSPEVCPSRFSLLLHVVGDDVTYYLPAGAGSLIQRVGDILSSRQTDVVCYLPYLLQAIIYRYTGRAVSRLTSSWRCFRHPPALLPLARFVADSYFRLRGRRYFATDKPSVTEVLQGLYIVGTGLRVGGYEWLLEKGESDRRSAEDLTLGVNYLLPGTKFGGADRYLPRLFSISTDGTFVFRKEVPEYPGYTALSVRLEEASPELPFEILCDFFRNWRKRGVYVAQAGEASYVLMVKTDLLPDAYDLNALSYEHVQRQSVLRTGSCMYISVFGEEHVLRRNAFIVAR